MGLEKMNRRSFLKKSAAATAAPYIIPSGALGNAHASPASERITIGHIGVGGRGTSLLNETIPLKDAQCVAVCDTFASRREAAAARIEDYYAKERARGTYHGCAKYNDFRELLARDDIDAVIIATPDHWHVPLALAAARAGKDMYVEKPLGLSVREGQALRDAVNRYGAVFQYGTQQRSERNFRFACELVRNEKIGKLQRVEAWAPEGGSGGSTKEIPVPEDLDYDLWLGPAPWTPYTEHRCTARGGYWIYDNSLGFIAGWAVHPLDIAQWGMDADSTGPVEAEGTGTIPTDGLYNTIMTWDVTYRYANGVELRSLSADIAAPIIEKYRPPKEHGTTFFGTEGWVSVDRGGIYADPHSLLDLDLGPDETHLYDSNDHRQNLLDCIKTRSETICPIEGAVRVDTLSQLGDIAIRLNRKIDWDSENEEIQGDPEAERMLSRPMRSPWTL